MCAICRRVVSPLERDGAGCDTGAEPHGITLGPDGALWTALETGALTRITV